MPIYPTREELREFAEEDAQLKVRALIQTFAMPHVDEDQIHKLLIDTIKNTYVAGYAAGWDASLDKSLDTLNGVERFSPSR